MEVGSNLNNALGIDSSIDISITDPVVLKGDGGIYDFLYEKGNQLTILAYALQNITNDLNTTTETTQDYFKAIAEEVEKEFNETSLKVDIETETFINKTFENVITAKSVTIDNTAKQNTVKALSGVLPIIEVKASDDLTTSVIRFAVSTLQEDIKAVANGSASAEKVASYTTNVIDYIAQDQNINSDDITPDISAIDDSTATEEDTPVIIQVLANDSYISTAPISITATNGNNGTVEVAESSPDQITYSPNTDYNGSDTFSYTITQGDKVAMADVNVTITPVNDAPSIDIASTIQVEENQTAVATISVSDPDGDELTLTLGGTDADSFNLSSDNVLSFKEAPDYETKTSYSISLTLTDGADTVTKDITIVIVKINKSSPLFTSLATFTAAENQTAIGTVTATDADGDDISFTVSGSELSITSAGVLTFVSAPDYETKTSYSATVTASDGTNSSTQDITVNITNVNEAPIITNLESLIEIDENLSSVITITATDEDGDDICFNITGQDKNFFQVDTNNNLIFTNAPDYEDPLDEGKDNKYDIAINASNSCSSNSTGDIKLSNEVKFENEKVSTTIEVQNIDEDLIALNLSSTPGTTSNAPIIIANFQIDSLTFAKEVQLLLENPSGTQFWIYSGSETNNGINWQAQEELSVYAPAGEYKIRALRIVRDNELDDLGFTPQAIEVKGFSTKIDVVNPRQDINLPEISQITSIGVIQNDGDENTPIIVEFNAIVNDASGIKEARIFVQSPGGQVRDYTATIAGVNGAIFEIELDPRAASGTYLISRFIIEDNAGNSKTFDNSDLEALNLPNKWTINNSIGDNKAPIITSLSLIEKLDASDFNRKIIKVSITTDSQESEIERIYIRLRHASEDIQIDEDFPSENFVKDASSYSLEFALPFEYPDGKYEVDYIWIKDKALNESNYEKDAIELNNWDSDIVFGNRYEFAGKTIDGYIAGAQVFIDQNFNFKFDSGEFSGVTDNEGNLKITLNDETKYLCLANRPLVANIPVGAIDSSLGVVQKSFKMVLPSINDSGLEKIVISPFSSLFAEQIINAKNDLKLESELTITEGCEVIGNNLASNISSRIQSLNSSLNSLGITYNSLTQDFIASPNGLISESTAQNIASFLPGINSLQEILKSELNENLGVNVNPTIVIGEETINQIFNPERTSDIQIIPISLFTSYTSEPNSAGWYKQSTINAKDSKLDSGGRLIPYVCLSNNESECLKEDLNLDSLANFSKDYRNSVGWYRSSENPISIGLVTDGSIEVSSSDVRYYDESNNNIIHGCGVEEIIQLTGAKVDGIGFAYQYQTNYNESNGPSNECDKSSTSRRASIEIRKFSKDINGNDESLSTSYTTNDINTSSLFSSKPDNLFSDFENVNPLSILTEISNLEFNISDIETIRQDLNSNEKVDFRYSARHPNGQFSKQILLSISKIATEDVLSIDVYNTDGEITSSDSTKGFEAFQTYKTKIQDERNSSSVINTGYYKNDDGLNFDGVTIDGYIQGAKVFIDQNFNFRRDDGELFAITGADGSFTISTNDSDLFNCLKSRPIVADVPAGAIDSTLGEVTKEFKMVLPSINDTGSSAIVISPFTSLLGDAIVEAKNSSSIKDDISLEEGCGDIGNDISSRISSELNQIKNTLNSSLNISYDDLLVDFIEDTSNTKISEDSAQNIAKFFPYFKELTDEFDAELSSLHDKVINTNVSIQSDSINAILSDPAISKIPLNFSAIYKTEPNDSGWFIEEKITAYGAEVNNATGELIHFTCFGDSENCATNELSLVSLRDASKRYTRTSSFINNNYNPLSYNYQLVVEDEQRVDFDFDGDPSSRVCILQNWLYLVPVNQRENFTTSDRYNTGASSGSDETDNCVTELEDKGESLFVALVDSFDDGTYFEEIDIRITNSNYSNSTFFKNKVNDIYNNRDSLDLDPLIQEISSIPRNFKAINILRDKIRESSSDQVAIIWTKRNSASQIIESSVMSIDPNIDNDRFEYATYVNSDTGSIRTEVINSSGQQARDDLFTTINSQSLVFNNEEFIGTSSVTDSRTSITGTTLDGYISGANVFFDVNFNQRLDAGEYSAVTDENGEFEIKVDNVDLSCIKDRPIVANIPVGAVDSSQGVVTKAYQMLLPSVNDAGSNKVVISPFTSLLAEAILKGKAESDIVEDLSVYEGCQQAGEDVASRISSEVNNMRALIENTYNISWTDLISDFIETGGTSEISESLAAKVASFFPYYKEVKDDIAEELSQKFEKDVTPNVSLSENSLNSILSVGEFSELPLEFFSVYKTKKNSAGWYQVEELSASNSFISSGGKLSREHCSDTDSIGCEIDSINIENVANASTNFSRQSNFFNDDISIAGLKSGSLAVYAFDYRDWRDQSVNWQERNNRARECRTSDDIQFQVIDDNNMLKNFHYSSYSQGYGIFDCGNYREYYYPKLNIATIFNNNQADNSIQMNYYITDILRSGIVENAPYDFVKNRLTIDPEDVIEDMAALPAYYSDVNTIRRKLVGDEYVLIEYHADPNISYFEMGTFPRNDNYRATLDSEDIRGQAARDAFFEKLKTEPTFDTAVYGTKAPTNESVLGRVAKSIIEIMDYKDSTQVTLPIYPSYNASSKTLNLSLINSELNVDNIRDFLENGINDNPLDAKIYYHPDDSISGTIPLKLYLYQGDDDVADSGEGYFVIEFSIDVTSALNSDYSAKQTFVLNDNSVIQAKYVEGDIVISKNMTNGSVDQIIVEDEEDRNNTQPISQPGSLQIKLLNIISKISQNISGIQGFFENGKSYTFKIDFGGFSVIDYERNTVDIIKGTFKVSDNPSYAINVNNVEVREGETTNICFYRPSVGDLSKTSMNLSFTQKERPGRGAFADDFSLSSSTVSFDEGDTEACIQVTGSIDNHFDWFHDAYLNISQPTNGQKLSRDSVKIRIRDAFGAQNRIGWYER